MHLMEFSEKVQIMIDMCLEELGDFNYQQNDIENFERLGWRKKNGNIIMHLEIYHIGLIHIFDQGNKNSLFSTTDLSQVKEIINIFKQFTEGFETINDQ